MSTGVVVIERTYPLKDDYVYVCRPVNENEGPYWLTGMTVGWKWFPGSSDRCGAFLTSDGFYYDMRWLVMGSHSTHDRPLFYCVQKPATLRALMALLPKGVIAPDTADADGPLGRVLWRVETPVVEMMATCVVPVRSDKPQPGEIREKVVAAIRKLAPDGEEWDVEFSVKFPSSGGPDEYVISHCVSTRVSAWIRARLIVRSTADDRAEWLYQGGNASAWCSVKDVFDFDVGASLAVRRLYRQLKRVRVPALPLPDEGTVLKGGRDECSY